MKAIGEIAACVERMGEDDVFVVNAVMHGVAARLLISRARDALLDPWCSRSGSLTGSPGGCHCVRRGSNFEILTNKNSLLDVVATAVPSADVASDASRRH